MWHWGVIVTREYIWIKKKLSLDIHYNQFHTRLKQKPLLTTALIGVKVSCPLAKVHGRPADCKFPVCECDKKNIKRLCVCFRIKGHGGQLMLQVCKQKYTEQKTLCQMKHIGWMKILTSWTKQNLTPCY